jgi:hypothetical protein
MDGPIVAVWYGNGPLMDGPIVAVQYGNGPLMDGPILAVRHGNGPFFLAHNNKRVYGGHFLGSLTAGLLTAKMRGLTMPARYFYCNVSKKSIAKMVRYFHLINAGVLMMPC